MADRRNGPRRIEAKTRKEKAAEVVPEDEIFEPSADEPAQPRPYGDDESETRQEDFDA